MEKILQWGLDCIRLVQTGANPQLTVFMKTITELGSAYAYLILIPLIYWCIDEKKCTRLAVAVLISVWINTALKLLLDQPRPFFAGYDPSVDIAGISEKLGGLPSGHAQNSLVLWVIIASWSKKKWPYFAAGFLCLLIGFSRVYLGMHFPTDIIGGWLLAGLVLCGYFLAGKRIEDLLAARGSRSGLITGAALSFIMILYRPAADVLMPAGMILGLAIGYYLCKRYAGFSASSVMGRTGAAKFLILGIRFLLGITVMILLYVLSGKIVHRFEESGNYHLYAYLRYALTALWVFAGAPWLFRFLRLAESG